MDRADKTIPRGRCAGGLLRRPLPLPVETPQLPNVEGEAMSAERDTKDGPFCWLSKAALKRILDSFGDDEGRACRTRSVYLALCEIGSDEGTARFIVAKGLLAFRAGLSARTVQRVFPDLVRAGVLTIERNATGLKTSSRYTLLPVPARTGRNVSTSGHGVSTIGHGGGSGLSPLYEERKEPKEPILAPNGASELFEIQSQPIGPASKVRRRDPLLDALAALDSSDISQVTPSGWRTVAAALKDIRTVAPTVTPEQLQLRARHYRQFFPSAELTAHALAKHWAKCARPPAPAGPAPAPQRAYPKL
jgi:hypothetical protein